MGGEAAEWPSEGGGDRHERGSSPHSEASHDGASGGDEREAGGRADGAGRGFLAGARKAARGAFPFARHDARTEYSGSRPCLLCSCSTRDSGGEKQPPRYRYGAGHRGPARPGILHACMQGTDIATMAGSPRGHASRVHARYRACSTCTWTSSPTASSSRAYERGGDGCMAAMDASA